MFRLLGQVDVIVTDSPIFLSAFYANKYPSPHVPLDFFVKYVVEQHRLLGGVNYFLNRTKPYNPMGRNQTEDESDQFSKELKYLMDLHDVKYFELNGDVNAITTIGNDYLYGRK
jgi:hypothetical protein